MPCANKSANNLLVLFHRARFFDTIAWASLTMTWDRMQKLVNLLFSVSVRTSIKASLEFRLKWKLIKNSLKWQTKGKIFALFAQLESTIPDHMCKHERKLNFLGKKFRKFLRNLWKWNFDLHAFRVHGFGQLSYINSAQCKLHLSVTNCRTCAVDDDDCGTLSLEWLSGHD